ncbi:MAG: c-type cytochrome [Deinococcota bacterium]|nr:c-type cytochrome [Deinococcota bacterium]
MSQAAKDTTQHHPSVKTYILIAVILAGITYTEYYIVEFPPTFLSSGAILFWLYTLSIAKFMMVIMFFMHLKYDNRLLSGLFMSGLIIGVGTLAAMLVIFEFFQPDQQALEARAGLITATATATVPHDDRVVPVAVDPGDGEAVYLANCASCHQANGEGVPGAFPQLTVHAPAIVLSAGGREYLSHVLLYGLQGEIEVLGRPYNGVMPPWSQLSDEEIRDVMNYIISAWGNGQLLPADFEAYSAEEVEAERDLGLSPQDVHAQRQEIQIIEISEEVALEEATELDVDRVAEDSVGAVTAEAVATAPADITASWDWQELGEQVYNANCASCHQPGGQGVPGAFPPLVGHSPDLYRAEGGRTYLSHVLLYGLQGEIEVEGQLYNGVMPAWPQLSDEDIAAAINHTLTAWGNDVLLPEDWNDYEPQEIAAERDLGLSPQDVHAQRQELVIPEAEEEAEAATEPVVEEPVAEEEVEAPEAPAEPVGRLEAGVHTLTLSPDELQGSDTITITVQDADGNVYSTALRVREGLTGIDVRTAEETIAVPAPTEPALAPAVPAPAAPIPTPAPPTPAAPTEAEAPAEPVGVLVPVDPQVVEETAVEETAADVPETLTVIQDAAVIFRRAPPEPGVTAPVREADRVLMRSAPPEVPEPEGTPEDGDPEDGDPEDREDAPLGVFPTVPAPETAPADAPAAAAPVPTPSDPLLTDDTGVLEPAEASEPPPAADLAAVGLSADEAHSLLAQGQHLYSAACVRCHLPDGQGRAGIASLRDNPVVQGEVSTLAGVPHSGHGDMPSLIVLSDRELAAVLSYLRQGFDNAAGLVTEAQVAAFNP